jgi:hypothetical protein
VRRSAIATFIRRRPSFFRRDGDPAKPGDAEAIGHDQRNDGEGAGTPSSVHTGDSWLPSERRNSSTATILQGAGIGFLLGAPILTQISLAACRAPLSGHLGCPSAWPDDSSCMVRIRSLADRPASRPLFE